MGYMHIKNLYADQEILMFKECYSLEKIHGSSAHILFQYTYNPYSNKVDLPDVYLFCGGCKKELFNSLWDEEELKKKFIDTGIDEVTIYGEGYGAGIQKGGGYGKDQDFILFDILIDGWWLNRSAIEDIAKTLGLKVVPIIGEGTLSTLVDEVREGFNSIWGDFEAEGIVARPAVELQTRGGQRIITKLKTRDFV